MDLFDNPDPPPAATPEPVTSLEPAAKAPVTAPRIQVPWRRADRPFEQPCAVCEAAAPCGLGNMWFCLNHVPADFWPANR